MLFAGCSAQKAKQPDPSAITKKLQSTIKFPEMLAITKDRLTDFYSVDMSKIKSFSVYACSSAASADEIAVFKCDSDADADSVKTDVESRKADKVSSFKNYGAPKEYKNIQSCVIETKGSYVIFAITDDNAKAQKTIDSFF
jgi:hypothetical protein